MVILLVDVPTDNDIELALFRFHAHMKRNASCSILPDGPLYRLDDFRFSGQIKTRITVGRAVGVDIQLTDPFVSGLHCFLQRQKSRVFVEEYQPKNPLLINGAPLRRGTVEILSGFVVQLGRSYLLACGRAERAQKHHILASGLDGERSPHSKVTGRTDWLRKAG